VIDSFLHEPANIQYSILHIGRNQTR